ncbi:MAG: hypothetical protein ACYDCK_11105, partial [Thermoplasmatota archaeon]
MEADHAVSEFVARWLLVVGIAIGAAGALVALAIGALVAAFADYSLGGLGSGCMSGLLSPPCSNQAPSAHDGSAARAFGLT